MSLRNLACRRTSGLGMTVERFDLSTGWNFDLVEHQEAFKEQIKNEMLHEILIAPECKLWSQMQNLNGVFNMIDNGITMFI